MRLTQVSNIGFKEIENILVNDFKIIGIKFNLGFIFQKQYIHICSAYSSKSPKVNSLSNFDWTCTCIQLLAPLNLFLETVLGIAGRRVAKKVKC